MKKLSLLLACGLLNSLHADTTFSADRLKGFYDVFSCEEKDELAQAGLSSPCTITYNPVGPLPTPPPPVPTPDPTPGPAPVNNMLPFVIVNNSGLPDTEVYVFVQGKTDDANKDPVFIQFDSMTRQGTQVIVTPGNNSNQAQFTQPLSFFENGGRYEFYLPRTDSFLIMFSLHNKLDIPVIAGPKVQNPAFNNPNDPNGNFQTVWDQIEGAFVSSGTEVNLDATAVAFFSIPLYLYLNNPSPPSGSNCGLTQSRSSILSYLESVFSTVPPVPERSQWQNLTMGTSPVYRVLSTENAMAGGYFDVNYLDNASAYGYSYISDIWSGPTSFYKTHPSSLTIKIPNGKTYTGTVQSDNSIKFTSGSDTVIFGPPVTSSNYLLSTSWLIFAGEPIYSSETSAGDGVQVSKAFQEAIIAGIVPTTSLINAQTSTTLNVFRPYYQVNSNLSSFGRSRGPWYDLYSASLHACGLIYTFTYDEPLWDEVQLQQQTFTPGTYIGITIGNVTN